MDSAKYASNRKADSAIPSKRVERVGAPDREIGSYQYTSDKVRVNRDAALLTPRV